MLRQLYASIQESPLTRYQIRGTFPTPNQGKITNETTLDLVTITFSDQEIIQIGAFPDHTRIGYMGESGDIEARIKTLNLPSTPNNLGDVVFHQLMRLAEQQSGPTYVEQRIDPGYEGKLERNLRKLTA